jgi:hypothetical protein
MKPDSSKIWPVLLVILAWLLALALAYLVVIKIVFLMER